MPWASIAGLRFDSTRNRPMVTLRQLALYGHQSHGDVFNPQTHTRTWVVLFQEFLLINSASCCQSLGRPLFCADLVPDG